jgi:hypothetical protein
MANEFYVRKGLIVSGSTTLSGSLQVQQGITGSLFGTASSATNAVSAPAGTLTGTTLASGVTASSLTSVGTLTSLAVSGNLTVDTNTLFVDAVNNRVGIGTATPATQLHVSSSGGNTAEIRLQAADGREYSIGSTGTGYGSTNNLIFYDVTVGAERLRINSSGQVGIGTTTPGAPLHVQGAISGSTMTLTGTATVQTLVETSTQELKKNITAMESTVTTLSKLEPSRFNWISTDEPDIGLIAEQVEQIFPELVTHAADGKLIGVKYSKLTVLLLKAVQEMSQRIESLEQQSIYKHTH